MSTQLTIDQKEERLNGELEAEKGEETVEEGEYLLNCPLTPHASLRDEESR